MKVIIWRQTSKIFNLILLVSEDQQDQLPSMNHSTKAFNLKTKNKIIRILGRRNKFPLGKSKFNLLRKKIEAFLLF